jgi:hypothetical protein
MTKKVMIMVLIPSLFIYLAGCYSMYDISKDDLKKEPTSKLWVITLKGDSYLFLDNSYNINQDTLIGRVFIENQSLIKKTIPLNDISTLKTEKINGENTALVVLGTAVVLAGVGILIVGAAFGSAINSIGNR